MDATQSRQSGEYAFPYHYLPTFERDGFTQGRLWGYSLSYLGAMELILDQLATRQPKTYCDVGCGDGALVHFLSRHPSSSAPAQQSAPQARAQSRASFGQS